MKKGRPGHSRRFTKVLKFVTILEKETAPRSLSSTINIGHEPETEVPGVRYQKDPKYSPITLQWLRTA